MNEAAAGDRITISFWQKRSTVTPGTFSFFGQALSSAGERGIAAHAPWSDTVIFFDSHGTDRITTGPRGENFAQWHHFAFVKDGPRKEIWLDGTLLAQDTNATPLPSDFTEFWIGSGMRGALSTRGDFDDFAIFAAALDGAAIQQLVGGTRPDQLVAGGTADARSTVNNLGTIKASAGALLTSANRIVNQGGLISEGGESGGFRNSDPGFGNDPCLSRCRNPQPSGRHAPGRNVTAARLGAR